jgi:hypothetical protein
LSSVFFFVVSAASAFLTLSARALAIESAVARVLRLSSTTRMESGTAVLALVRLSDLACSRLRLSAAAPAFFVLSALAFSTTLRLSSTTLARSRL